MPITTRSYFASGVAALGAGAMALSSIQPLPNHAALTPERVDNLAVALASTIDPITPWVETFQTAAANVEALSNFYAAKPFPILQTIGANIGTYLDEAMNGNAGLIADQIGNNIQTFFEAPWNAGACNPCGDPTTDPPQLPTYTGEYISNVKILETTVALKFGQRFLFTNLPAALGEQYPALKSIVDFTATYYSGQLIGLLAPVLAPIVSLTRSFSAVGEFFQAGDVTGAINELINVPANLVNAVLNGAGYLDLTEVVNAIQPLPEAIKSIGLNLGGLISPPVPTAGELDAPTAFNGGVLFDSLAVDGEAEVDFFGVPVTVGITSPGLPVSWVGSAMGLGQFLGEQLLVTPPPPPPVGSADAGKLATPMDSAPPALREAAADDADTEVTSAVVDDTAVTEDAAPVTDVEMPDATVSENADLAVVDIPEVEAPAGFAGNTAAEPATSVGSHHSGDSGSRATHSHRGTGTAD